jgi:hypothetical protein
MALFDISDDVSRCRLSEYCESLRTVPIAHAAQARDRFIILLNTPATEADGRMATSVI